MNTHSHLWPTARGRRYGAISLAAAALALGALVPAAVQADAASVLYVSQGGLDHGSCTAASPCASVSYALTKAPSGATIEVSGTIQDHPVIATPVTVTTWPGGPAGSPAVIDGTASGAVVTVAASGVTLHDLTVEHGALGVYNREGVLTLSDSTVTGNSTVAEPYAGLWNFADSTATVIDSTIAGNSGAGTVGAGIDNNGTLTVVASTIAGNHGGGIYSGQDDTASLGATIVAGNTGHNCGAYDAGSLDSAGYNLTSDSNGSACSFTAVTDHVDKNPLLGSLAANGGPTRTLLPAASSPAANVIPRGVTLRGVTVCPGADQRGAARPGRGETGCTIGAAEASYTAPTATSVSLQPAKVKAGARVIYLATVAPHPGTGTPAGTVTFTTGSTVLCQAVLSGGVAACGSASAPAGTRTVTAAYSGGGGFAASSGKATLTVTKP